MNHEACAEMDFIIANMSQEDINKIPESYIKLFKENKSDSYKVKLNNSKPLNEQEILDDTKTYLSAIYREFLCSESEKKEYEKQYQNEIRTEKEQIHQMLQHDIFYNKEARKKFEKEKNSKLIKENHLTVYKKENFFKKICKNIKKILGGRNGK